MSHRKQLMKLMPCKHIISAPRQSRQQQPPPLDTPMLWHLYWSADCMPNIEEVLYDRLRAMSGLNTPGMRADRNLETGLTPSTGSEPKGKPAVYFKI